MKALCAKFYLRHISSVYFSLTKILRMQQWFQKFPYKTTLTDGYFTNLKVCIQEVLNLQKMVISEEVIVKKVQDHFRRLP